MTLGYFYLFLCKVSADFNKLHSVEEWSRDVAYVVGRSDEHNL